MQKHAVAKVDELAEGGGKSVRVGGDRIALFLVAGEIRAYQDFCPHAGAPLSEGLIKGGVVRCLWHGWEFDLKTGMHVANPRCALDAYQVEVIEGTVFVWT